MPGNCRRSEVTRDLQQIMPPPEHKPPAPCKPTADCRREAERRRVHSAECKAAREPVQREVEMAAIGTVIPREILAVAIRMAGAAMPAEAVVTGAVAAVI